LTDVVIHDSLGICDELEQQMQHLVDTYRCEWKAVAKDPEKRKLFRQFVNTDETEPNIEFVDERGQLRPADWPRDVVPISQLTMRSSEGEGSGGVAASLKTSSAPPLADTTTAAATAKARRGESSERWISVGTLNDFPKDGGAAIKVGKVQIAVFNFASRGEWYACQNMCPHKNAFVLSRGIVGTAGEAPKVSCPLHKKPFSLQTGESLSGEDFSVKVFPVKVAGDAVYLKLPPQEQLDALLATDLHCIRSCSEAATACRPEGELAGV
jgi:nitrite reductase (NADH) large subunit